MSPKSWKREDLRRSDRSPDGKHLAPSRQLHCCHGFGDPQLWLCDQDFTVAKKRVVVE